MYLYCTKKNYNNSPIVLKQICDDDNNQSIEDNLREI